MADFPRLKTGAVTQYPVSRTVRFRNQILRFLGGKEQRYRDAAGPLHQWRIRLDLLDEGELTLFEQFFAANRGQHATFAFTDPWSQQDYANCSLGKDSLELQMDREGRCRTSILVVENGA